MFRLLLMLSTAARNLRAQHGGSKSRQAAVAQEHARGRQICCMHPAIRAVSNCLLPPTATSEFFHLLRRL
jgi:hypothetical protein